MYQFNSTFTPFLPLPGHPRALPIRSGCENGPSRPPAWREAGDGAEDPGGAPCFVPERCHQQPLFEVHGPQLRQAARGPATGSLGGGCGDTGGGANEEVRSSATG